MDRSSEEISRAGDLDALKTRKLTAIITIIRRSGYKSDKVILQKDWDNAKKLAAAYARAHHEDHVDCRCCPDVYSILMNGVSSNFDISALNQIGVNEFRAILDSYVQQQNVTVGRIAIIILQNDGLSSNCLAMKQFFDPYRSLDAWLCIQYYDRVVEHPLEAYLDAIEDWQQGRAGNTFPHSLIRILVGVSMNKEL